MVPAFAKYWPKSSSRLDFEAKRTTGALFPAPPGDNESENREGSDLGNFNELEFQEKDASDITSYINPFNPFYYDHAKKLLLWWNSKSHVQKQLILNKSKYFNIILYALMTMYQYLFGVNSYTEGGTFPSIKFRGADIRTYETAITSYTSFDKIKQHFRLTEEASNEMVKNHIIRNYMLKFPIEYVRMKYEYELKLYKNNKEKLDKIKAGQPTIAMLERLHKENPPAKIGTGYSNQVTPEEQAQADRLQEQVRQEKEEKRTALKEDWERRKREEAEGEAEGEALTEEEVKALTEEEREERIKVINDIISSQPIEISYIQLLELKLELQRLFLEKNTNEDLDTFYKLNIKQFTAMINEAKKIENIEKVSTNYLETELDRRDENSKPIPPNWDRKLDNLREWIDKWKIRLREIVDTYMKLPKAGEKVVEYDPGDISRPQPPPPEAKKPDSSRVQETGEGGKRKSHKHRKKTHKRHRTRKHRKPKSHKKRKSRSRKKRKSRMGRSPHKTHR